VTESSVPKATRVVVKVTPAAVATPGAVKAIRAVAVKAIRAAVAVKAIRAAVAVKTIRAVIKAIRAVAVKAIRAKAAQDKVDKNKNRARANSPPGVRTALKPGAAGLPLRTLIRKLMAALSAR
jgi:hypothetical protein